MSAFDDAWNLVKYQESRVKTEEKIEEDPYASVRTPMPVAGNKGDYSHIIRNIANKIRLQEMFDATSGGAGMGFAARPDVMYVGNEINPLPSNFLRRIKEDPKSLEWNFDEEYGIKAGDRLRLGLVDPNDERIFYTKPITEDMIDAWHEATNGAYDTNPDRMINIPLKFREKQRRLNELISGRKLDFYSDEALERDRLVGILQPQMIGGHFRMNTSNDNPYLTIGSRGPPASTIKTTNEKIGSKAQMFEDMYNDFVKKKKLAGMPDAAIINSPHFFYPPLTPKGKASWMGIGRSNEQKRDRKHNYDVWSKIMNDDGYIFNVQDALDFLPESLDMMPVKRSLLGVDLPYLGDEAGEHKVTRQDWGEKGGFTHNIMSKIKPYTDKGINVLAFNTGDEGIAPKGPNKGRMKKDIMRDLYRVGGLNYRQIADRLNVGVGQKGSSRVGESIGTNIEGLTQDVVNSLIDESNKAGVPIFPEGFRGGWRHNAFSNEAS